MLCVDWRCKFLPPTSTAHLMRQTQTRCWFGLFKEGRIWQKHFKFFHHLSAFFSKENLIFCFHGGKLFVSSFVVKRSMSVRWSFLVDEVHQLRKMADFFLAHMHPPKKKSTRNIFLQTKSNFPLLWKLLRMFFFPQNDDAFTKTLHEAFFVLLFLRDLKQERDDLLESVAIASFGGVWECCRCETTAASFLKLKTHRCNARKKTHVQIS